MHMYVDKTEFKQFLTQVLYTHQYTMRCCFHTNRHIILSVAAKLTLTQWLCSLIKPWIHFGYNTALKILISLQIIWNDTHAMLHTIYVLVCIQWVKPCYAQNILGICFPSLIKTQTELSGEKFPVFTWVLLSDCTLVLLFCFQPLFLSLPFAFFVLFFCLFLFCFQPLPLSSFSFSSLSKFEIIDILLIVVWVEEWRLVCTCHFVCVCVYYFDRWYW